MIFKIFLIAGAVLLHNEVNAFTCSTIGRFQNEYDPSCKSYYLCSPVGDQIFGTLYRCTNSSFDPVTQSCSVSYVCEKSYFTCSSSGFFPDLTDESCTRYFNCFNFFGIWKFSQYCIGGFQFDPNIGKCSNTYDCASYGLAPEEPTTTETAVPSTISITEEVTTFKSDLTEVSSLLHDTPKQNVIDVEDFECTVSGTFPDKSDLNCRSYFYCIPMTGGMFVKRKYKCQNFYNPDTKSCTNEYICTTTITTSSPFASSSEKIITESVMENDFNTSNTGVVSLKDKENTDGTTLNFEVSGIDLTVNHGTEEDEIPDENTTQIISQATIEGIVETTSKPNPVANEYTTSEKFETETQPTEGYTNISLQSTSRPDEITSEPGETTTQAKETTIYIKEITEVIENVSFDTGRTTDIIESSSDSTETTTKEIKQTTIKKIETTTEPEHTIIILNFECRTTGRFPNTLDTSCTQYFLCSKLNNGTFLKTPYACPNNSYFDPNMKRCSKTYVCHNIETTTESLTTSLVFTTEAAMTTILENEMTTVANTNEPTTDIVSTKSPKVLCTTTGRYPDLTDFTCTKYFLCSKLYNGSFIKTEYTCPGSFFDPVLRVCSKNYICPYVATTTIIVDSTTIVFDTSTNVSETTTATETTTHENWSFSCNEVGRFMNKNDGACKSYFLCNQLRNGTFIKTEYDCPSTSIFNPKIHICSTQISCF